MTEKLSSADSVQYKTLISAAADHVGEPVCGKPGVNQLPRLKPEDIALITRCFAVDVADQLDIADHFESFAADIEAKDFCRLGARMAVLLERACRGAIAYAVMCELEQREIEEQRERDDYRWMRGISLES